MYGTIGAWGALTLALGGAMLFIALMLWVRRSVINSTLKEGLEAWAPCYQCGQPVKIPVDGPGDYWQYCPYCGAVLWTEEKDEGNWTDCACGGQEGCPDCGGTGEVFPNE